jgi:FkbM family methyltransferase
MYPKWTFILLPFTRLELPGWSRLLKLANVLCPINDTTWNDAPKKIIKGKIHNYWMELELSNWSQRMTYFLGRYYELSVQKLMNAILKPGDRFIDIGANIGEITLHASHLVGENGKVESFEPNPECVSIINNNVIRNDIKNIKVFPFGLSDRPDVLKLNLTSAHSGTATLAPVDKATKSFEVQIITGDSVVLTDTKRVRLIKIDVEGFELQVLKGLKHSLEEFKPLLITEIIESQLERAGTSGLEIEELLRDLGYMPYGISTRRKWIRHELHLIPLDSVSSALNLNDILWVHKQDSFEVKKFIH